MMIPHVLPVGTPCDIDELCQIHVYRPYIDNQINRKVSGAYFFFLFLNMGGQGALNFSNGMIFSLIFF